MKAILYFNTVPAPLHDYKKPRPERYIVSLRTKPRNKSIHPEKTRVVGLQRRAIPVDSKDKPGWEIVADRRSAISYRAWVLLRDQLQQRLHVDFDFDPEAREYRSREVESFVKGQIAKIDRRVARLLEPFLGQSDISEDNISGTRPFTSQESKKSESPNEQHFMFVSKDGMEIPICWRHYGQPTLEARLPPHLTKSHRIACVYYNGSPIPWKHSHWGDAHIVLDISAIPGCAQAPPEKLLIDIQPKLRYEKL